MVFQARPEKFQASDAEEPPGRSSGPGGAGAASAARGRRGWRAGSPRRRSRGRRSRRSPSRRAFSRAGAGPRRWSPPAWRGILQCTRIMAAARDEQKNPIQVIERMMRLLDVLAQHPEPLGLKQISQYTGLHPSTAHRILAAMSGDRLVDRVEPGSYRLGMRLLELGNLVKSRISVRELALPVMRELHAQTGETVNLSVRHGDEIVYVERSSSGRSAMRVVHVIGARAPLHVTAAGKLFLLEEGFARLRDYAKRTGLAPQKAIPPKYFYDRAGSRLFERICRLPEYYLTRTELSLTRKNISTIARFAGRGAELIEYGSGESLKSRLLIRAMRPAAYLPVDI